MSEEKKTIELKDEELGAVYGGGSGTIPAKGITYETYTEVKEDNYYSSGTNTNEVAYVYKNCADQLRYTKETFICSGNGWNSTNKSGGVAVEWDFISKYPYKMILTE